MKIKTMLLTFALIFTSCILAKGVMAQYPWDVAWDPDALAQFLFPGMSREWLRIPDVLYYVILPFIAAFTVIYGILRELRIFRGHVPNKVNIVLAFCMAFMLLPSGVLTLIVTFFYAGSAFIGMMAFGVVFLIGIILWGYGTTGRIYRDYSYEAAGDALKEYNKRYADLQRRLVEINKEKVRNPGSAWKYIKEEEKINEEMNKIAEKWGALRQMLKTA